MDGGGAEGQRCSAHEELTLSLLRRCTLTRLLQQIFEQLVWHRHAQVLVCGTLALSLSLRSLADHARHPLRPYQTFLFSSAVQDLMAQPRGAEAAPYSLEAGPFSLPGAMMSPALGHFIAICSPLKSFADIQIQTGLPLSYLYRIAAHLGYWGCGRIIDKITMEHLLVLNLSPHGDLRELRAEFAQRFGSAGRTFDLLLSLFAVPHSLRLLRQKAGRFIQNDFGEIFVWMLRKNLLRSANTYYYLLVPDHFLEVVEDGEGTESEHSSHSHRDVVAPTLAITAPRPLSAAEEQFLNSLNDGSEEFSLFYRLCPYFHGRHSLQEILWRESITPQQLDHVIQTFSSAISQVVY